MHGLAHQQFRGVKAVAVVFYTELFTLTGKVLISLPLYYTDSAKRPPRFMAQRRQHLVDKKSIVDAWLKKVFFLNHHAQNIMIVGHQAVNRMILAHFLFRRDNDVPYIYIPQDQFYHIVSTQNKKLFELKPYA